MIQKLKDTLNSTITWFLVLLAALLYFWKKEKDLEYKLEETKANDEVKSDKEAVAQADQQAATSTDDYQSLRDAYLRGHKDDTNL